MSVFQQQVKNDPVFGQIIYFSSYWKGQLTLSAFDQPFSLIIRASREGPTPAQRHAMQQIIAEATTLRQLATTPMLEMHQECGILPPDACAVEQPVWCYLQPEQIDVTDDQYYQDNRIAILLIFISNQNEDFAPAIETADGQFISVLSGT